MKSHQKVVKTAPGLSLSVEVTHMPLSFRNHCLVGQSALTNYKKAEEGWGDGSLI